MKTISIEVALQRYKNKIPLKQKSFNDGNELVLNIVTLSWDFRGKANNRGISFQIAKLEDTPLELAQAMRDHIQQQLRLGVHHSIALETFQKSPKAENVETVDECFDELHKRRLVNTHQSHEKIRRNYYNHISPKIGKMKLSEVRVAHIDALMFSLSSEGVKAAILTILRKIFEFAYSNDLVDKNRIRDLKRKDYGIKSRKGGKTLAPQLLPVFFASCKKHEIARVDLLAIFLFLALAVRKRELVQAPWDEFNLDIGIWDLPEERAKEGVSIAIPLCKEVIAWLRELKSYSPKSKYLFPARKQSDSPTIDPSTLNYALEPVLKELKINVHGKRHLAYTLLEKLKVPKDVREMCLNHRDENRGDDPYSHWAFYEERQEALEELAKLISEHAPANPFL